MKSMQHPCHLNIDIVLQAITHHNAFQKPFFIPLCVSIGTPLSLETHTEGSSEGVNENDNR